MYRFSKNNICCLRSNTCNKFLLSASKNLKTKIETANKQKVLFHSMTLLSSFLVDEAEIFYSKVFSEFMGSYEGMAEVEQSHFS